MSFSTKKRAARLSVISNSLLIILKLATGVITGSVSIISEAIHSAIDLIAAVIAFFAVKLSDAPADEKYPFGYGKIENVSGVIEALLIFVASIWIITEAVGKILHPADTSVPGLGVAVMGISAIVNIFVSRRLYKVARETRSVALEADALHLRTDVITSAGVAAGLALIWLTGWQILDPVIALGVAAIIIIQAWKMLRKAFTPLLDTAMPADDIERLNALLDEMGISYHDMRTREAGHRRFVEFHLDVLPHETIETIHRQCDMIEERLGKEFPGIRVTIHPEPNHDEKYDGTIK